MSKTTILLVIMLVFASTINAQIELTLDDPCDYISTDTVSVGAIMYAQFYAKSVSPDYNEKIELAYAFRKYTRNLAFQSGDTVINYVETGVSLPLSFKLNIAFKKIDVPDDKYDFEIIFSNGKKIKRRLKSAHIQLDDDSYYNLIVPLKQKHLRHFKNSPIKEIIINGQTRTINPQQAHLLQLGAECMSVQQIFRVPESYLDQKLIE